MRLCLQSVNGVKVTSINGEDDLLLRTVPRLSIGLYASCVLHIGLIYIMGKSRCVAPYFIIFDPIFRRTRLNAKVRSEMDFN